MSGAPPFNTFPNPCSSEDDSHFNMVWEGIDFGQQEELPRSPYSFTSVNYPMIQSRYANGYSYGGYDLPSQPQFGYVPPQDHSLRNALPRIDTKALVLPRAQMLSGPSASATSAGPTMPLTPYNPWVGDNQLQIHVPQRTPSAPYSPFLPMGLSRISSPISPQSPAAMGSSDKVSSLKVVEDDDEDAPQPREHVMKMWRFVREQAVIATGTDIYIPQALYKPYTEADRVRYIEKANLKEPIIFMTAHPDQWGIALDDALRARMKDLINKDDNMFQDCGPSVSIRLQWPGYRAWTKQIPTMDFRSPKGPITRAKLAKNVANCIKRFIDEKEKERMEMEADRRWRVGARYIRMEDLILVSLHHISKGSWQPQLRLRTPLSEIQHRRAHIPPVSS